MSSVKKADVICIFYYGNAGKFQFELSVKYKSDVVMSTATAFYVILWQLGAGVN